MKSPIRIGIFLASAFSASTSFAARTNYKAELEGSSVGSNGTGTGKFTYDDVTKKLCGSVEFTLQSGAVTSAGLKSVADRSLVRSLTAGASPLGVDVTLTSGEGATLVAPGVYIAIGTAAHPIANNEDDNGELTGELVVDGAGVDQCPVPDGGVPDGGASDGGTSDGGALDAGSEVDAGDGGDGATDAGLPPVIPPDASVPISSGGDASVDLLPTPEAKDGGGCSASGSASSGAAGFAMLVATFLVGRLGRRRRR